MTPRFAVLVSSLVLCGCGSSVVQPSQPSASTAGSPQQVTTASVESQKLSTALTLPGQVMPYEVVDVYPKVTGFIETIRVDRGSRVRTGELIIHLSAPELVAQGTQAEATLHSADAQLSATQAKLASDRGTLLHLTAAAKTPGVVAGNDVLVAEQTVAADQAQVEAASNNVLAARDGLRAVKQLESYLDIRAPFDGVVTQRNLHPGALVGPASGQAGAQPIIRIETINRLRIVIPVPEAYTAGVKEGQQVSFRVPAYPDRAYHAPISRISNDINQNNRTMLVELDFHNGDAQISPGSFANIDWPIQRSYATLFVPATAVTTDLQQTFVIRIQQGKAQWVDVKTGVSMSGKTEVFGELQAGDIVVRNATDSIRAGTSLEAQGK